MSWTSISGLDRRNSLFVLEQRKLACTAVGTCVKSSWPQRPRDLVSYIVRGVQERDSAAKNMLEIIAWRLESGHHNTYHLSDTGMRQLTKCKILPTIFSIESKWEPMALQLVSSVLVSTGCIVLDAWQRMSSRKLSEISLYLVIYNNVLISQSSVRGSNSAEVSPVDGDRDWSRQNREDKVVRVTQFAMSHNVRLRSQPASQRCADLSAGAACKRSSRRFCASRAIQKAQLTDVLSRRYHISRRTYPWPWPMPYCTTVSGIFRPPYAGSLSGTFA